MCQLSGEDADVHAALWFWLVLFTQLAIRFSFWVTASLPCGLSCGVCTSFHQTVIGMRETFKQKENVLFEFLFFIFFNLGAQNVLGQACH